jgi:hypothetical protein
MSTIKELRVLAKALKIKNYSTAKKADLIAMLEQHNAKSMEAPVIDMKADVVNLQVASMPKAEGKKPEVASMPKAEGKKPRGKSSWTDFLSYYRKEHGVSLKEAMTKKEDYVKYKANLGK